MANKDLLIGGISNYTYDIVKYWINSAKMSGFSGDIVLTATNIKAEDIKKISSAGVIVVPYGHEDAEGNYTNRSQMPPHVDRFLAIWNFLRTCSEEYRYVVTTDVRDVVFQRNPSEFFEDNYENLIIAGEGLKYKDEPWGNNNYLQAFGPFFHEMIKEKEIYNVGVIAGRHRTLQDIILLILQLSINRPINIVDQAVYNFLINTKLVNDHVEFFGNDSAWTINLGTTLAAIQSGAGDIGQKNDPTAQITYQMKYLCSQPTIKDGVVYNSSGLRFHIVHQYDRVAGLVDEIRRKYDDKT